MNYLALDFGAKMGWCLFNDTDVIDSGMEKLGGKHPGKKFINMLYHLTELHKEHEIKQIHYEDVKRHLGTMAAHAYGGYKAIMLIFCDKNDIPYTGHSVGTIKKHVTGNGAAKKQMVIDAINGRNDLFIGQSKGVTDDNEADAIAIALLAQHNIKEIPF